MEKVTKLYRKIGLPVSGIPDNVRNSRQTPNPSNLMIAFHRRIGPDPHANGAQTQSANGCPDIWEMSDGDFAIIGPDITELAGLLPPTAGCGPDEKMIRLPRRILVGARPDIPRN